MKARCKRKQLGYNTLNNHFNGSQGHHINKNDVIYIPKEMHRSIYHNGNTGQGMQEINKLAIDYLFKTESIK